MGEVKIQSSVSLTLDYCLSSYTTRQAHATVMKKRANSQVWSVDKSSQVYEGQNYIFH